LVPRALAAAGRLERFVTDVYFGRNASLDPLVAALCGSKGRRFRSQQHPSLPASLVRDYRLLAFTAMVRRGSAGGAACSAPAAYGLATGSRKADSAEAKNGATLFRGARRPDRSASPLRGPARVGACWMPSSHRHGCVRINYALGVIRRSSSSVNAARRSSRDS